jgi:hypothetical protein
MRISTLFILLSITYYSFGQKKIPSSFCITEDEKKVFDFINKIRKDNNKKSLTISGSLCYVANVHVDDLLKNHPDTSICNLSSWSDKGDWTPCCYNSYIPKPLCIKNKPKEITPYPYYGYEYVSYFEDGVSLDSLFTLWKTTKEVQDMILTNGYWHNKSWAIAGVGINKNYVSVWFGQKFDKTPTPKVCKSEKKNNETVTSSSNKESYYYVIYLSLEDSKNVKEALRRTRKNGFKDSGVLENDNKYRIYLKKFSSLKEALHYKDNLSTTYKNAWILKN